MKDSTGFRYDDLRVHRRQSRQRKPGRHGLARRRRHRGRQCLFPRLRRRPGDGRQLGRLHRGRHGAARRRCGQHLSSKTASSRRASPTSCASAGRKKSSTRATSRCATPDILHGGIGACGQTFGLLGFWGANGASGDHSGVTFENLLLDNWYSLLQMEQEQPALHGFTFRNIWALDQPPLAASTITGDVKDVTL